MDGFHSLWSKPYMAGKQAEEYWMQDYEVLTMILSALMWRKHNGGIRLCADAEARAFIEKLGLAHIWNLGIEEITVPEAVPEKVFWAAGKLYSLKKMQMPAVMVDLDLIIWKDIRNIIKDTDICAILHPLLHSMKCNNHRYRFRLLHRLPSVNHSDSDS